MTFTFSNTSGHSSPPVRSAFSWSSSSGIAPSVPTPKRRPATPSVTPDSADAVAALVQLGMAHTEATRRVRDAVKAGCGDVVAIINHACQ